jgi:hypothetical protein
MTAYLPILNSEIDPESPITESLMQRLRDNPIAIVEGSTGAPVATPGNFSIGGSGADGVISNATPDLLTTMGFLDADVGSARSTNWNLSPCTVIRFKGTFTLSAIIRAVQSLNGTTNVAQQATATSYMNAILGGTGGASGPGAGAGGGAVSAGGLYTGGGSPAAGAAWLPALPSTMPRPWHQRRPLLGGNGGQTSGGSGGHEWGPGGGHITLIIEGDLLCTGGTLDVSGWDTDDLGSGGNQPGGGGGGSLFVLCTGTITDGTYKARGGSANVPGGFGYGGAGSGGWVHLVASAFSGTQTIDVAKGTSQGGASGTAGYSAQETLPANYLRSMIQRF